MNEEAAEPEESDGQQTPVATHGARSPFGPMFFLRHLTAFVRERCPAPSEGLPAVLLHLMDGEVLDVCHVIGLAPDFVALAVNDTERDAESREMRTEIVPYETIHRITVRSVRPAERHVGFVQERAPQVFERIGMAGGRRPQVVLRVAATMPPLEGAPGIVEGDMPRRPEKGVRDVRRH